MSPPFFFLLHSLKDPERTRHANTKLRYRPGNLDELGHGSVRKIGLFADSQAVVAVNNLSTQPDFIAFTGDLTHTTEDPKDRRRLGEFKEIASQLKVKNK